MRVKLVRSSGNPIIEPRPGHAWERKATFNPGAVMDGVSTHILYRAVNEHGVSSLGYAETVDGEAIINRSEQPVFSPEEPWEEFGCEDPRITAFDQGYYVFYTAFSRRGPRIAMASTTDFKSFERHGIVGPDLHDKDCALFPRLIDGKAAMVHRVAPNIQLEFFHSTEQLRVSNPYWNDYEKHAEARSIMRPVWKWEEQKIGLGPPPIPTNDGWLIIYHAVDSNSVYRAGAALLDLENPRRVIARLPEPILEPEEDFEKVGLVPNVVFPEGAVIVKDELRVFYGAADSVCCVASTPLELMMEALREYS